MNNFYVVDEVTGYDHSKKLREIGVDHPSSWTWIKINDQEPIVVFKKWIVEHKPLIKGAVLEYRAYHVHELIEILGDTFGVLERVAPNRFAARTGKVTETGVRPQDALASLLIEIYKNQLVVPIANEFI